jgi:hypothetical protein
MITGTDIWVHDRLTGRDVKVSVDANGVGGDGMDAYPFISADGHYVAYSSSSSNLVPGFSGLDAIVVSPVLW